MEPDNFKAQVRAFPVVVVQPDSSELACGRKISLDRSSDSFQTQDIETGHANPSSSSLEDVKEDPSHSSREERSVQFEETVEKGEGEVTYNPLTHYLTGIFLQLSDHLPFTKLSACVCKEVDSLRMCTLILKQRGHAHSRKFSCGFSLVIRGIP